MKSKPLPALDIVKARPARPRGTNAQAHLINRFAPSLRIPTSPDNWKYLKAMRHAELESWNAE